MTIEAPVRETALPNPIGGIDAIFKAHDAGNLGWMIGTIKADGTPFTYRDTLQQFKDAAVGLGHPSFAHGGERQVLARFMAITQIPPYAARQAIDIYDGKFPQQP